MKREPYIINPSELSYICYHCNYLKQNYNYFNSGVPAGVTQTLDGMEKEFFLGDSKKIDESIPDGETINPFNNTFYTRVLEDNKDRPFRIKGKCDALIKFNDKTSGIIDYKTSKYEKNPFKDKDSFKREDLEEKIKQYDPQLHCYDLLYRNLETDVEFLKWQHKNSYPNTKDMSKIADGAKKLQAKSEIVKIQKTSLMGLFFISPKNMESTRQMNINFAYKYRKVEIKQEAFMKFLTAYIDILYQKAPPPYPEDCGVKKCFSHKFFYDEKKLIKEGKRRNR